MSGADDLFSPDSEKAPAPVDRLRRVSVILAIALPLNLLGVFCCTGVPGAVLALVGWQLADEEVARVESGALPKDQLPRARRKREFAFGQLVFVLISMLTQMGLFWAGTYDGLVQLLRMWLGALLTLPELQGWF